MLAEGATDAAKSGSCTDGDTVVDFGLDARTSHIVARIIRYGIENDASDIHLESDVEGFNIRYRIDGLLQPPRDPVILNLLKYKALQVVVRIKVLSNLDIAERRLPQDGNFKMNYVRKDTGENVLFDFRVATIKGSGLGENVTIRILDPRKAKSISLDRLSLPDTISGEFRNMLKSSAGIILVTGPTGSGKSTTLYASLKHIYNPGIKIVTAEDPIEYSFPGISQTQVNPRIGMTFAAALRSFLRLDPDVMLVGEIRDGETADIAFRAAQTGHLLLSTLHTNDSTSAILRLRDLDIGNDLICSALLGIMSQRLIRLNCPTCSEEYVLADDEWSIFFDEFPGDIVFRKGKGCSLCSYSGFKGRMSIAELFVITDNIKILIMQGLSVNEIRKQALKMGMKTIVEVAMNHIERTTIPELIKVVPHHLINEFKELQRGKKLLLNDKKKEKATPTFKIVRPGGER